MAEEFDATTSALKGLIRIFSRQEAEGYAKPKAKEKQKEKKPVSEITAEVLAQNKE